VPKVTLTPHIVKIYNLAVDGRGRDSGITIPEIAGLTGLTPQGVAYVLKRLEKEGYVVRMPHTKRPIFFLRGPNAGVFDEAYAKNKSKYDDGGTVNAKKTGDRQNQEKLNAVNPIIIENVSTLRTHLNGKVTFEVFKIGDMQSLKEPDGSGGHRNINLFPKSPYLNHNNVQAWKTKIQSDGVLVSIELFESKNLVQLFVFPPEVQLTQHELPSAKNALILRAKQAVSVLTKYGGWLLGEPTIKKGEVEYANTDSPLSKVLPDIPKTEGSQLWTDRSYGDREVETNSPATAAYLADFIGRAEQMDIAMQDASARISSLERTLDKAGPIIDKMIQLKLLEIELVKSSINNGQDSCKEEINPSVTTRDAYRDFSVMYQ